MNENLDKVHDALQDLSNTPARNLKMEKLKEYLKTTPWLKETILYALHPHWHYNTNRVTFVKTDPNTNIQQLFNWLYLLARQKGATDTDIMELNKLSSLSEKTVQVVSKIIKKDLRCGIQATSASKLIPELPTYEVMKAESDNPFPGKEWKKFIALCGSIEKVVWSLKVDGYRTSYVTVFEDKTVEYLSTAGKPYNFHIFDPEMIELATKLHNIGLSYPIKFDGECISKDGDFQTMQKQARRLHDTNPEIYRLLLWEVVTNGTFKKRYDVLDCLKTTTGEKYDILKMVDENPDIKVFRLKHNFHGFFKTEDVTALARRVISEGNEGLMMKSAFHEHEYKRSKHWFKLKALYLKGEGIEIDLPVIGFEYGKAGTRMEKMLGSFVVEYKGTRINVSGKMTDGERIAWAKDLPSWIEINADSETDDGSLRFPIFQRIREDK